MQVPVLHSGASAQHGSPSSPHSVQTGDPVVFEHTVSESVHESFGGQHGESSRPHSSQKPDVPQASSVPAFVHAAPVATQVDVVPLESQQPDVHVSPAQQGSPGEPHGSHVVVSHTVFALLHASPVKTHSLSVESQQPSVQAVPVVQQAPPA